MGQQLTESWLIEAMKARTRSVDVRTMDITSLRSQLPADRHLPLARLQSLPWSVQKAVGRWAYGDNDIVHRLDPRLPPSQSPEVLTIHDLAPMRFEDEGDVPPTLARSIAHAAAIICPSQFTADEVREEYGAQNVHVIPNGLDPAFQDPPTLTPDQRRSLNLPTRWVLHAGGTTERKNLEALAAAWPIVRSAYPTTGLVMVGPPHVRREKLFREHNELGAVFLGKVERSLLLGLVAGADAVVVPSVYEGFGLPALEAMACGVSVVASNASSLPEVTQGMAILVDPSADGIARGLMDALMGGRDNVLRRAQSAAREQTWEKSAVAHLAVYQALLDELGERR